MSIFAAIALAFIAGLIIGGGTYSLYSTIHRQNERIHSLYTTIRPQNERIRKLEQASAKRLPYQSADEIENGIAALLYTMQDLSLRKDMLENALAHLKKARNPELFKKK
jgi:hypothetical protein